MKVFLVGALGSACVAIVYGLVFVQRESAIREYLRTSARGMLRWFYVQALFQAVRGDAVANDSRNIAVLICLACFTGSLVASSTVTSLQEAYNETGAKMEELYKKLAPKKPETLDDVRRDVDALKAESDKLRPKLARSATNFRILSSGLNLL